MQTKGKVAIITGAIKGIGLEIAKAFAKDGIFCVLTYYDWQEHLNAMHETMSAIGTPFHAIEVDLTKPDAATIVVGEAISHFGRLDILVNNIERGGWPVVHGRYTEKQWELEFATTVTAKWRLYQASLAHLKESKNGIVINISSVAGIVGRSGSASLVFPDCYSLANRAVSSLTETWAREAAPEVRINELMLGFVDTRHAKNTRGWSILTDEQKQALIDHILLKRTGLPEEVAKAAMFLVKDADYMTGSTLRLDGGYVLGGEQVLSLPDGVVSPDEPVFGGKFSV